MSNCIHGRPVTICAICAVEADNIYLMKKKKELESRVAQLEVENEQLRWALGVQSRGLKQLLGARGWKRRAMIRELIEEVDAALSEQEEKDA